MSKLKTDCPIHDTLTGYDFRVDRPLGRKMAIRKKCLECCAGSASQVRHCDIYDCTLWPWRSGRQETPKPVENEAVLEQAALV
jgi:hypothetical protein